MLQVQCKQWEKEKEMRNSQNKNCEVLLSDDDYGVVAGVCADSCSSR